MNWRKVTIYFIAPLCATIPMILMYFSGVDRLQHIISPEIEGIYGNSNRELGLLETLENVALIVTIVVLVRGVYRVPRRDAKVLACIAVAFVTFVLLEEIDYGLHYYEFLAGIPAEHAVQDRNWHNVGDRTSTSKQLMDVGMVLAFLIGPFVFAGSAFSLVRTLVPDRYAALSIVAMFVTRSMAHGLQDAGFGKPGTMDSNLSEFREFVTYYIWAVYSIDVFERRLRGLPRLGDP